MTRNQNIYNNLIDGQKIQDDVIQNLEQQIDYARKHLGLKEIKIVIIVVGNHFASRKYITSEIHLAQKVGIMTELVEFDTNIGQQQLIENIYKHNCDERVSGIIVPLPMPEHIDNLKVIDAIAPEKDVDAVHPTNLGLLFSPYNHRFVPSSALACLKIIQHTIGNGHISGKKVAIIGRSAIVGRPLSALLLKHDATITLCHSQTESMSDITCNAEIVISAIGKARFLTQKYFNENAIVIDVGINPVTNDQDESIICGDVDIDNVRVKNITPVPGGVGLVSIAYLMVNSVIAAIGFEEYHTKLAHQSDV